MPAPTTYPRRIWTNYLSTAANTNQQTFNFATPDDYRDRYIETIFVGLSVSGLSIMLQATGQEYDQIDTTRFAAGDPVLRTDFIVRAKLQLQVVTADLAGLARANIPVIIGYRVDPTTGP